VIVGVGVMVGVREGVWVIVAVRVMVGDVVIVGVCEAVEDWVTDGVIEAVAVDDGMSVNVAVEVIVAVGVGLARRAAILLATWQAGRVMARVTPISTRTLWLTPCIIKPLESAAL
jgi:hypothetical protein